MARQSHAAVMGGIFFLGIDGGGSGCRARLVDGQGRVLGEGRAGPASLRLGADVAWRAIMAAVQEAMAAVRSEIPLASIHAGLALAGVSRADAVAALEKQARAFASATIISDGIAACLGAHGGKDGGIVSVGTGSIALAISGGRDIRIGGYGLPVSDEGSGAAMGVAAVRHLLQVLDGRVPACDFSHALSQPFHDDMAAVAAWLAAAGATEFAALAPVILAHADQDNPHASAIMREAAVAIAALVEALADRGVKTIALTGGLGAPLRHWLPKHITQNLVAAQGDAMDGAILAIRRRAQA